jgi:hypothetical protein
MNGAADPLSAAEVASDLPWPASVRSLVERRSDFEGRRAGSDGRHWQVPRPGVESTRAVADTMPSDCDWAPGSEMPLIGVEESQQQLLGEGVTQQLIWVGAQSWPTGLAKASLAVDTFPTIAAKTTQEKRK